MLDFRQTFSRGHRFPGLVAALVLGGQVATAASFPCDKASTAVEKTICAQKDLSVLDDALGRYYAAARGALGKGEACLAADQRAWIRGTRDACKDAACLKRAYLERLAVLDGVQPGASKLRDVDLPKAMPLMGIVPPALDEEAAPRNRPTKPFVARGRFLDDIATGDGFVLQSADGVKHVVVPAMFLEPEAMPRLTALARTPGALYEVRGQSDPGPGGEGHFSASRCTYIYRVSP